MSKINQNSYYGHVQLCLNTLFCFPVFLSNVTVCICGLQRAESRDSRCVTYPWKETAALLALFEILITWTFPYSKKSEF